MQRQRMRIWKEAFSSRGRQFFAGKFIFENALNLNPQFAGLFWKIVGRNENYEAGTDLNLAEIFKQIQ